MNPIDLEDPQQGARLMKMLQEQAPDYRFVVVAFKDEGDDKHSYALLSDVHPAEMLQALEDTLKAITNSLETDNFEVKHVAFDKEH